MRGAIISYVEMCKQEGASLQRGMNYRLKGRHSVILMSQRPTAPYHDRFLDDGTTLIYEGHDCPKKIGGPDPKAVDQAAVLPSGKLTENGKFMEAVSRFKTQGRPDLVRVYEKVKPGIWYDNGYFHLVDGGLVVSLGRNVFRFHLEAVSGDVSDSWAEDVSPELRERSRIIPSEVRLSVWKRDKGKCVICGASDELHFDHVLPYSKGGTSISEANVQLLCARHNLSKGAKIV